MKIFVLEIGPRRKAINQILSILGYSVESPILELLEQRVKELTDKIEAESNKHENVKVELNKQRKEIEAEASRIFKIAAPSQMIWDTIKLKMDSLGIRPSYKHFNRLGRKAYRSIQDIRRYKGVAEADVLFLQYPLQLMAICMTAKELNIPFRIEQKSMGEYRSTFLSFILLNHKDEEINSSEEIQNSHFSSFDGWNVNDNKGPYEPPFGREGEWVKLRREQAPILSDQVQSGYISNSKQINSIVKMFNDFSPGFKEKYKSLLEEIGKCIRDDVKIKNRQAAEESRYNDFLREALSSKIQNILDFRNLLDNVGQYYNVQPNKLAIDYGITSRAIPNIENKNGTVKLIQLMRYNLEKQQRDSKNKAAQTTFTSGL